MSLISFMTTLKIKKKVQEFKFPQPNAGLHPLNFNQRQLGETSFTLVVKLDRIWVKFDTNGVLSKRKINTRNTHENIFKKRKISSP